MNTTTETYKKYMFYYGILTILFILEHFEQEENYEECHKIIEAIKQQEKYLDIKLFTRMTNESISLVIETYKKFNLTGENAVENSKHYAQIFIDKWNIKQ